MVKQRIKQFCEAEGITVSSFEKSIGASNRYVNSITRSVGLDKLNSILEEYPYLNIEWLLTGRGNMIRTTVPIELTNALNVNNMKGKDLKEFLASNGISISHLAKLLSYSDHRLHSALKSDDLKSGLLEDIARVTDSNVCDFYVAPKDMIKEAMNERALAAILNVIDDKGFTKSKFAGIAGISKSTFSEILNNRMKAGLDLYSLLVSKYGVSASWLLTGEGAMYSGNGELKGDPTVLSLINKIAEQAKEIGRLEQALEEAKREKGSPAYDAHTAAIADAG